jgi:hypothetical protein
MNFRHTKAGMREAHQDLMEARFRTHCHSIDNKELVTLEAWLEVQLAKLHSRFIWKRDRLQCKLGIVKCEIFKRTPKEN